MTHHAKINLTSDSWFVYNAKSMGDTLYPLFLSIGMIIASLMAFLAGRVAFRKRKQAQELALQKAAQYERFYHDTSLAWLGRFYKIVFSPPVVKFGVLSGSLLLMLYGILGMIGGLIGLLVVLTSR